MFLIHLLFLLLFPWLVFSWRRWPEAVAVFLALLPTYLWRGQIGSLPTTWLELALYCLVLVFIVKGFWRFRPFNRLNYFIWLVFAAGWLLLGVWGVIVSTDTRLALGIFKGWLLDPLLWGGLAWVALSVTDNRRVWWHRAISALLAGATVTAVSAIWQGLGIVGRLGGWYNSPNVLAMYLLPVGLLSWGWFTLDKQGKLWPIWFKFGWVSALFILLWAIILTGSYTALISLIISLAVWYILQRWPIKEWRVILIVVLCLTGIVLPWLVVNKGSWPWLSHNNSDYAVSSGEVRYVFWREAERVIVINPWSGIGLGQWQPLFSRVIQPTLRENHQPGFAIEFHYASLFPHNLWLTVWLFQGLMGVAVLLVWLVALALADGSEVIITVLSAWLVYGLTDTPLYKNDLALLFVVLTVAGFTFGTINHQSATGKLSEKIGYE